jgi:mono/diheme cytochrome c family protein
MDSQNKKFYFKISLALIFVAYLLYKNPTSTGNAYMPDMAYAKSYETYSHDTIPGLFNNVKQFIGSLMPVKNTISREALPSNELYQQEKSVIYSYRYSHFYQNNDTDKVRAGNEIFNPYTPTPDVLKRGEVIYVKQCAICHGEKGMGDGPLIVRADGTSSAYKAVPPSYADRLKTLKDGEIFHSIAYGKNLMGGYASHIKADDRWKLVCYIKELGGLNGSASTSIADSTKLKTTMVASAVAPMLDSKLKK